MLAFFVLSAIIYQFGQIEAGLTDDQILKILDRTKSYLKAIPLPPMENENFKFRPIPTLFPNKRMNASIKMEDIWIKGLDSLKVNKQEITRDPKNPARFNVTLRFPKFQFGMKYDFETMGGFIENAGDLKGDITNFKAVVPVEYDGERVKVVGSICFNFDKKETLEFANSKDSAKDLLFTMFQCMFHDGIRVIIAENFIPYCELQVTEVVNGVIAEMKADGTF